MKTFLSTLPMAFTLMLSLQHLPFFNNILVSSIPFNVTNVNKVTDDDKATIRYEDILEDYALYRWESVRLKANQFLLENQQTSQTYLDVCYFQAKAALNMEDYANAYLFYNDMLSWEIPEDLKQRVELEQCYTLLIINESLAIQQLERISNDPAHNYQKVAEGILNCN